MTLSELAAEQLADRGSMAAAIHRGVARAVLTHDWVSSGNFSGCGLCAMHMSKRMFTGHLASVIETEARGAIEKTLG